MCGSRTYAKPDMCIETSRLVIKLLVQEDKSYKVSNQDTDAESQVFAEAIASFQGNSKTKKFKSPLEAQLIPCITLLGTYPTFYLFKVTKMLSECVKMGNRPKETTIVKRYDIPAEIDPYLLRDAMLVQEYRQHIFQCYEAFKKFVFAKILPLTLQYLDLIDGWLETYIDIFLNHCNSPLRKLIFEKLDNEKNTKALIEFCVRKKTLNCVGLNDPSMLNNNIRKEMEAYVVLVPYEDITIDC
ncbi:hypothetical protein F8M41_015571 [Gigaspora margarita]|uniref:Uncharacterized protein n=1 Tax=Gigaspora margarita TaxID=4874 RepID=A0A8H3WWE0_GIGMA|nr:hypothetical protein F8M41_015571 [Gigaspora margarita]